MIIQIDDTMYTINDDDIEHTILSFSLPPSLHSVLLRQLLALVVLPDLRARAEKLGISLPPRVRHEDIIEATKRMLLLLVLDKTQKNKLAILSENGTIREFGLLPRDEEMEHLPGHIPSSKNSV
jgi:hypothetical protein